MRGTKCPIGQRRGADNQGPSSPIPIGGKVARVHGVEGGGAKANRPRPALFPKRDPARFGVGKHANLISRGYCDMGWFGAACAVPDFRPLGLLCGPAYTFPPTYPEPDDFPYAGRTRVRPIDTP